MATDPARDPVATNPQLYRVVLENDRVRVLEYRDAPGDRTATHAHPDSVLVTLSSFRRRLRQGEREVEVELAAHEARWLDAQEHSGANTGGTASHSFFIELKEPRPGSAPEGAPLGPR